MIEHRTHLPPSINVCLNIGSQCVTVPTDRSFLWLGEQAEPLRRYADGPSNLPKPTDIADLSTTRQDLRYIRSVHPKPVRKLRLRQALLLHEVSQDNPSVSAAPALSLP
jgi:hypothetical protein